MQAAKFQPKIERLTKLIVPHEPDGSSKVFVYPSFGPNTYQNVGREILKQNYKLPEANETASLLHAAYCSEIKDEPEFHNVREIMRNRWLWIFSQNLWTDKGLYFIADENAEGLSRQVTVNILEEKLKGGKDIKGTNVRISKDGKIRFVPKDSDTYLLGEQTADQLSINDIAIAQYLKEGAEKLGEIAAQFKNNSFVYGLDISEGQNPELRVSAVDVSDDRLRVLCTDFSDGVRGYAFGIL